ncbi:putative phosphoenolpyruvate synthase, partial [Stegodyphus mimosarum]
MEGNVKEVCESLRIDIENTEIPKATRETIEVGLKRVFGENFHSLKFAIRSSATGEDTEQMSAAGQMDTFLGVLGINEILRAVKKCWASQFGYVAIQYKRRYGQCLNSPMAVVIQEMVACEVAGVLFTCDPLTGNPAIMIITANYGLGESVVSGSEEPDTIELQRDPEDLLSIKSTNIGAKSRKIIVKDGEGTVIEDVSENEKSNFCLSEDMVMRLGKLGIEIQRYYRSHRDIEWGFCNNQLYVFQSRPVTAGFNETVFEVDHEFDCPLRTENDFFSMANVGEVMPGAMSPLGMDYLCKAFDLVYMKERYTASYVSHYFRSAWVTVYNHMMFNVADVVPELQSENLDFFTRANLTSLFGKAIRDKELSKVCSERYGDKKKEFSLLEMLKLLLMNSNHVRKEQKYYANFRVPVEKFKCSKDLFSHLLSNSSYICNICACHMKISGASSVWNMIILSVLAKANGDFNEDVYRDFASLITTSSDVESADVPSAIQSLAFHISEAISADDFKKMNTEEALNWLQRTSSTAGVKYREFLEKHGHRCLKECDVHSVPWGSEPKSLVKLLQSMAGSVCHDAEKRQTDDTAEVFSQLSVPLGFFSRLLLKFLLPMSRRGVQNREMTKSILVKVVDEWRKAFRHLAKLMVSEGRIPDADILYFMTLQEIKDLLDTRSPKILVRAAQRERRHPILDKYIFPEIMKGIPKPINLVETPIVSTDEHLMMKGVPVSQGVTEGYVRVAITLEEAALLKPKEILVTYSTDIGWTPYFPTLAGVVTELGGLISHGAVVSREYGIPCIAAMYGATRRFQTGNYVRLDGNTGILQKIPPPNDM